LVRLLLHIGYDGSKYSGWQRQPNAVSVQEIIEQNLEKIFHYPITVYGCGRTDAGVHASQYVMHINIAEIPSFDLKFRLNKNLPDAIAVYDIIKITDDKHTRYHATFRTYDYFIHLYKAPAIADYSSYYELENLNLPAMKKLVDLLPLYEDYKSFCKQPHLHNHTRCTVTHANLFVDEHSKRIWFSIRANRFLRGMIRILVSFILKVGKGEMTVEEFETILSQQIEIPNKQPAFPNGLYLSKIEYPFVNLPPQPSICDMLKQGMSEVEI